MRKLACIAIMFVFVGHVSGCVDSGADDDDDEVTAEDAALLAEPGADADEADLVDGAVVEDDAATFDTDEVEALPADESGDVADLDEVDTAALDEAADAPALELAAKPLLAWGLHPRASDALRAAGVHASRIVQTIGNARASVGYHKRDGYYHGRPYTAAVDLSVRNLSKKQIRNLIERLGKVGYAAWYRENGKDGWRGVNHIHAVYARCKMKSVLRAQIRSWLAGRNGLGGNATYHFHKFSHKAKATVKAKFAQSHHGTSNR